MTDEPDSPEQTRPGQPAARRRFGKRRHDPGLITQAAHDSLNVSRAFGTAYERDGVRVIPVARVVGGTSSAYGGGSLAAGGPTGRSGSKKAAQVDGEEGTPAHRHAGDVAGNGDVYGGGGGFGTAVKPLGVVVIDDTGTHWRPTVDVNRVILGGQLVATVAVLTTGWVLGRRHTTVHRLGLPALPSIPILPHLVRHQIGRAHV